MKPVPYAMMWQMLRQHRTGLSIYGLGVIALVIARLIAGGAPGALVACSMWMFVWLLYFVGVSTQPGADISGPGSCYPTNLFVLPVRTRDLVAWPMLFGVAASVWTWVLFAGVVLSREPHKVPIVWPACMIAAVLTSLQALFWTPMRFGMVRVIGALAAISGFICLGVANPFGWPEGVLALAFGVVAIAAFAFAVNGVSRARRSASAATPKLTTPASLPITLKPHFVNANRAQRWYDWRRGGIVLPVVTAWCCAVSLVPLLWEPWHLSWNHELGSIQTDIYTQVYLGALIRLVPFIAWIMGGSVRISGARFGALSFPSFVATKPMTTFDMALARLGSRLKSASLAFAVLLLGIVIWLLYPALHVPRDHSFYTPRPSDYQPLILLIAQNATPSEVAAVGLFFLLVFALTARNLLVGQFASLSGSPRIAYGYMGLAYGGPVLIFIFHASTGIRLPAWGDLVLILALVASLKVVAGAAVVWKLVTTKVAPRRSIAIAVGVWCAVAAVIAFAIDTVGNDGSWLARLFEYGGGSPLVTPVSAAVMAIVWTPFVRLAAAPLMLAFNRRTAQ